MPGGFTKATMTKLLKFPPKWLDKFANYTERHTGFLDHITEHIANCDCEDKIKTILPDSKDTNSYQKLLHSVCYVPHKHSDLQLRRMDTSGNSEDAHAALGSANYHCWEPMAAFVRLPLLDWSSPRSQHLGWCEDSVGAYAAEGHHPSVR